jgi:hypothetical protein
MAYYNICPEQRVILPEMEAAGIGTREEKIEKA